MLNNISSFSSTASKSSLSNFQGKYLRVAAVMSQDYEYDTAVVQKGLHGGNYEFRDSFSVELLRCLEFTMNFTTIPVITHAWGHLLPNNTWVGMVALLLSDKADIGLSSIADRPFRRAAVDFNIPTNDIRLSAFFRRPSSTASSANALLEPFTTSVWVATIGFYILTALSAFIIANRRRKWFGISASCDDGHDTFTLLDSIFYVFPFLALKSFPTTPSAASLRILFVNNFLAAMVLFAAFSGTLVSFLSVVIEPIQNMGQLVVADFQFVLGEDPLLLRFLAESPDTKAQTLYNRRVEGKTYPSLSHAAKDVNEGGIAFITDHASAYEALSSPIEFGGDKACLIREIEIENARQKQGTIMRKGSPYKRIIDYQILKTLEKGLVMRWNNKYLKKKPTCESVQDYSGVPLISAALSFAILVAGGVFSFFFISLEIVYSHHCSCKDSVQVILLN